MNSRLLINGPDLRVKSFILFVLGVLLSDAVREYKTMIMVSFINPDVVSRLRNLVSTSFKLCYGCSLKLEGKQSQLKNANGISYAGD